MPSFGGGGGQTVPATFSQGGNPAPYQPSGQPAADTSYQSLMQGLINPSLSFLNQGQPFPAVQQYPEAQYLTNLVTNNPYFGEAQQAAGLGAQYGQAAGQQAYNTGMNTFPFLAGNVTGLVPDLQSLSRNIMGQAPGIADQTRAPISALQSSGNQVLGTAFDPQQAMYNQMLQQTSDQQNAALAQAGLSGSPYAAGLQAQNLQNFGINWQNQQLARQAQGISAANQAFQGAGGLNTAALGQLAAALGAGAGGAQAVGGLEQTGANILGQGANLANMGAQGIYQAGQLPYQQLNQFANQGSNALANLVQLGNQQYTLPQQTLNDLQSYLNLGQAASGLAGQLGNQGFNQGQQGLANTVGLAGLGSQALFGSGGPFGSSGLVGGLTGGAGLGGLFGGGFSAAAPATFADTAGGFSAADLLALPFFG